MMPIGPLMIEHRLIERMIRLLKKELEQVGKSEKSRPCLHRGCGRFHQSLTQTGVTMAKRRIFFSEIWRRKAFPMSTGPSWRNCWTSTTGHGRRQRTFLRPRGAIVMGDTAAVRDIVDALTWLVNFYPIHIEKEDRQFFMPVMAYLSQGGAGRHASGILRIRQEPHPRDVSRGYRAPGESGRIKQVKVKVKVKERRTVTDSLLTGNWSLAY